MNQTILIRLEKEAEKMVLQIPAPLDSKEFTWLFNEKFAELIVRECAGLCDLYAMPDGVSETAMILSAAIKRKFGVEE
jgi:hypothetical protein